MRLIHSYTEMDLKSNDSGSSWQGDSESSWLQDTEDSSVDSGARSISGGISGLIVPLMPLDSKHDNSLRFTGLHDLETVVPLMPDSERMITPPQWW